MTTTHVDEDERQSLTDPRVGSSAAPPRKEAQRECVTCSRRRLELMLGPSPFAMPDVVRVTCVQCGKPVDKDGREYRRSTKLNRPFFCGLSCSAIHRNAPKRATVVEL